MKNVNAEIEAANLRHQTSNVFLGKEITKTFYEKQTDYYLAGFETSEDDYIESMLFVAFLDGGEPTYENHLEFQGKLRRWKSTDTWSNFYTVRNDRHLMWYAFGVQAAQNNKKDKPESRFREWLKDTWLYERFTRQNKKEQALPPIRVLSKEDETTDDGDSEKRS